MAEIMDSIVHGLVFFIFGYMFIFMVDNFTGVTGLGNIMPPAILGYAILAIPFFLMGFFDKMLD